MKHTDETKKKLSEIRKKWITDNPEKHTWKRKDKQISKPCEFFKDKLKKEGIEFIEEVSPIKDRGYSVDVVIPDRMIGFEINGNQHYNSDRTLKDYYKKRKDEIEKYGLILYDIHYTKVFNEDFINEIVNLIKYSETKVNFDFNFYQKNEKGCCDCNKKISYYSVRCLSCHNLNRRGENYEKNLKYKTSKNEVKSEKGLKKCKCGEIISIKSKICFECYSIEERKVKNRPDLNTLVNDVEKLGYTGTGRKYGVSDNCIRKWINRYNKK